MVTRSIKFSLLKINEDGHQTEFRSKADGNETVQIYVPQTSDSFGFEKFCPIEAT